MCIRIVPGICCTDVVKGSQGAATLQRNKRRRPRSHPLLCPPLLSVLSRLLPEMPLPAGSGRVRFTSVVDGGQKPPLLPGPDAVAKGARESAPYVGRMLAAHDHAVILPLLGTHWVPPAGFYEPALDQLHDFTRLTSPLEPPGNRFSRPKLWLNRHL